VISGLVVLISVLASATWIDVPFTAQEKNGCGSASVWMVMEYWDKSPQSPEEIQRILYSKEAGGVVAADMEQFFAQHRFRTVSFQGEWNDLTENIAKGRPLIVSIEANSRGTLLHYVLVTGVDETQQVVFVNDPARRKLLPITRSDFEKSWNATNRWTLLVVPEGVAEPTPRPSPAVSGLGETEVTSDPFLEQASLAFRSGDLASARRLARKSLQAGSAPGSALTNEFLATVFFLEDNLDAALKYWNRNGAPRLREVRMDFQSRWNPVLLDYIIGISRATVLRNSDYRLAQKRLEATGTFSKFTFDLSPLDAPRLSGESEYDLNLRAAERGAWSPVSWLRGLPYQTVTPEFRNLGGRSINIASAWRWDVNKRRLLLQASGPVSPSTRYEVGVDARNEIWERDGQIIPVRKQELRIGLGAVATSRWSWASGAIIARRPSETSLKYDGSMGYDLLRIPEKRLAVNSEFRGQFGRALSTTRRIARLENSVQLDWFPRAAGEDYRVLLRSRSGSVWGSPKIDELFSVGVDRDEDYRLRGHSTTRDGRKGAAPLGRRYVLWNVEISKTVLDKSFFKAALVPFFDVARVGSTFVDAGAELRLSVASMFTFSVSAGRDLRAGRTVVFTNAVR
jgi:predicted double-glycine peptidase